MNEKIEAYQSILETDQEPVKKYWKKNFYLFMIALISLSTALFFLIDYLSIRQQVVSTARDHARIETRKAITAINKDMEDVHFAAKNLAGKLASGELRQTGIPAELKKILANIPKIVGIGVAYVPHIHAADIRNDTPYYVKRPEAEGPDSPMQIQLFTIPFSMLDPSTQNIIIKGVVFVDYSLYKLKALMNTIDMGKTGYGYILSRKGQFLSHPMDQYVMNRKNLFVEADLMNDRPLKVMAEYAAQGRSGFVDYMDPQTGFPYWISYEPIPLTGWYMMGLFLKERNLVWSPFLLHKLVRLILTWLVCLMCLYAFYTSLQKNNRINYSNVFTFMGVLLFCAIASFYYIVYANPNSVQKGEVVVNNKAGMTRFLIKNASTPKTLSNKAVAYVPTGVYIKSVLLGGQGKTTVTGTIWQSYDGSFPKGMAMGVAIPNAKAMHMSERYRYDSGGRTVIGWDFEGIVDQRFDYASYPLDRASIRLEIQHKEFAKNIILMPDIGAYNTINPAFKPGVNPAIHVAGWAVEESYFSYLFNDLKTNFGIDGYIKNDSFPILYYTIFIKRQFINAFIGYMMPPFVVCLVLFIMLSTFSEFKTTQLIGSCSSMFFIMVLTHIRLRGETMASEIIYLEYFYFVIYLVILAIISMAVFINSHPKKELLQKRYGPITKMLYWPSILTIMLTITILTYFN